uniref:Uncharacterized protein n=1 Tax=Megaselia scalaris TaxID=36166 RepID=T1H0R1_MEGSC
MQARENLGFIAEALQDCQTILNLDPKNAEAQQSLKKLEALLEKFDEAITDCDKAIELDDKFVKAYYRRMQANECLGLAKRALEDCTKVLEIDPKNTEAKASFQRINQRIKRYEMLICHSFYNFVVPQYTISLHAQLSHDQLGHPTLYFRGCCSGDDVVKFAFLPGACIIFR